MAPRTTRRSPAESIESFAIVLAQLDDPFADRGAVFASEGITEQAFGVLQEQWAARLLHDTTDLRVRFADAYTAVRRPADSPLRSMEPAPSPAIQGEQTASEHAIPLHAVLEPARLIVPSFMKPQEPAPSAPEPVQAPPAEPARAAHWAETGPIDLHQVLKPSVPFDASASSKMAVPTAPSASPPKTRSLDGTETVELDLVAFLRARKAAPAPPAPARAAVTSPAVPPVASPQETSSPRRRLIRFDPQTGAPLATPYWEDLPDEKRSR